MVGRLPCAVNSQRRGTRGPEGSSSTVCHRPWGLLPVLSFRAGLPTSPSVHGPQQAAEEPRASPGLGGIRMNRRAPQPPLFRAEIRLISSDLP